MQRKQSDSPERYDNNECTNVFSISQNKENRKLNDLKEPNSKECNIVISLNASDNNTMEQTEPVKIDTISANDIHPNKKVNFLGKKQYPKKTKPFCTIKEDEDQNLEEEHNFGDNNEIQELENINEENDNQEIDINDINFLDNNNENNKDINQNNEMMENEVGQLPNQNEVINSFISCCQFSFNSFKSIFTTGLLRLLLLLS